MQHESLSTAHAERPTSSTEKKENTRLKEVVEENEKLFPELSVLTRTNNYGAHGKSNKVSLVRRRLPPIKFCDSVFLRLLPNFRPTTINHKIGPKHEPRQYFTYVQDHSHGPTLRFTAG